MQLPLEGNVIVENLYNEQSTVNSFSTKAKSVKSLGHRLVKSEKAQANIEAIEDAAV